jgi:hypothetical protein
MPTRQLSFKQYVAKEGEESPPVNFWWRGLPGRRVPANAGQLLAAADLAEVPLVELSSGYLEAPWHGHPPRALLITTGVAFVPGDRYAVSLEPASPPNGSQALVAAAVLHTGGKG